MRRTDRRRGDGKIGCLFWLAAALLLALVLWNMVPVKMRSVEFYDYLGEQAKFAQRASAEVLKKRIVRRAEQLELPLEVKNLKVEKSDSRIRIECSYTVPVEFPGYTYQWSFEHVIDEPIFYF